MNIFERKPKYSPDTGEQVGYQFKVKEERCDFSGEVLYQGGHDNRPWIVYSFHYEEHDACYGAGGIEYELAQKYDIEVYIFLSEDPYKIAWKHEEAAKQAFIESDAAAYGDFLRECRTKTAMRLLEEGTIEAWQVEGHYGPEEF